MKLLVLLVSSVLALTSGSYAPPYVGPIHIPIIGPNGVPIEPQEVLAARASHLAAHAETRHARHGYGPNYNLVPAASTIPAVPPAWTGPFAQVAPDGTPLDTPEVHAAKLKHLSDYSEAAVRNAVHPGAAHGHFRRRRSIGWGGFPLAYQTSQAFPVIGHDGQPVETPEVQDAKARHFATHAVEAARNARGGPDLGAHAFKGPFLPAALHAASSPFGALTQGYGYGYHIPLIGPGGVPVEPPEVQAARAQHLAAYAQAKGYYY